MTNKRFNFNVSFSIKLSIKADKLWTIISELTIFRGNYFIEVSGGQSKSFICQQMMMMMLTVVIMIIKRMRVRTRQVIIINLLTFMN